MAGSIVLAEQRRSAGDMQGSHLATYPAARVRGEGPLPQGRGGEGRDRRGRTGGEGRGRRAALNERASVPPPLPAGHRELSAGSFGLAFFLFLRLQQLPRPKPAGRGCSLLHFPGAGRGLGGEDIQSYSCLPGRFQRIEARKTAELGVKIRLKRAENNVKVERHRMEGRKQFMCPPPSLQETRHETSKPDQPASWSRWGGRARTSTIQSLQ